MDNRTLNGGPDKRVPPDVNAETRSLRIFRRGTLVVPGDRGWMIKRQAADVTSTYLRGRRGNS
ncbi:MAG: hypothetical protein KatS3mg112_0740 [Thermogutta sp.]|nr:MAG: hypothetical protein KatS3mg112_0740 [Thermogutta sp.]